MSDSHERKRRSGLRFKIFDLSIPIPLPNIEDRKILNLPVIRPKIVSFNLPLPVIAPSNLMPKSIPFLSAPSSQPELIRSEPTVALPSSTVAMPQAKDDPVPVKVTVEEKPAHFVPTTSPVEAKTEAKPAAPTMPAPKPAEIKPVAPAGAKAEPIPTMPAPKPAETRPVAPAEVTVETKPAAVPAAAPAEVTVDAKPAAVPAAAPAEVTVDAKPAAVPAAAPAEVTVDAKPAAVPASVEKGTSEGQEKKAPDYPVKILSIDKVAEVVTLQNVSDKPVNISGWRVKSWRGTENHPGIEGTLEPGQIRGFPNTGQSIWSNKQRDDGELYDTDGNLISYWKDIPKPSRKKRR